MCVRACVPSCTDWFSDTKPYPADDNPLLEELTDYLDACGMGAPITKIYITAQVREGGRAALPS